MQKYIEINWLQDVDIIHCNALSPYIYDTNDLTNNCDLYQYLYHYFIKNLKMQNNKI